MASQERAKLISRFGPYELDITTGDVFKDGHAIPLQPQQQKLLTVLVNNPGRTVSRDEIRQVLWPGQSFGEFEDGLNHAVIRLRRALGDSAEAPRFIETIPGRGYKFIAPTELVDWQSGHEGANGTAETGAPSGSQQFSWLTPGRVKVSIVLCAALLIFLTLVWRFTRGHEPQINALAVLPLLNLTGDDGQEFLSDGVTEDLTTQLARIDPLRVVSRTSAMRYRGTRKSIPEIGRELTVDAVIEGAVQRPQGRIRITVQMIGVGTDRHLWANTYEGGMADIPLLEAQATRDIASQLKLELSTLLDERLKQAHRIDPSAYEAYQRGRRAAAVWDRPRLEEAIRYFELAIQKDPAYAPAYAQLAHAYGMIGFQRAIAPDENTAKFRKLTQKALELDGGLAEAHVDLGDIEFYGDWDWSSGEGEFQRAVELDRGSVDAQEHYALCLWVLRRYDAAIQEMRRALRLDPLSPRLTLELGSLMQAQGDREGAIRNYKKALELEPGYGAAFFALANVYEELGRDQEAIAAYLRAASLGGEDPKTVQQLSEAFESGGFPGYWKFRLRQLQIRSKREPVSPLAFAAIYVRLGQHENAINWLERAYRQHIPSLVWINANRAWDPLRADRRFENLLLRMGFPRDHACRGERDADRINDAAQTG